MKAKFIIILLFLRITRLSTLFTLALPAAVILFSAACSHADFAPAETGSGRKVRAGIFNFKPLVIFDLKSPPTGFIVDIFNEIAKQEEWLVEYVPGTWQQSLERLRSDKIDIILCIGYSAERDVYLDFPKEHVLLDWGLVYRKKGSDISSIMDMQGKTVAAMKASIYTDGFRTTLEQFNIKAKIVEKTEVKDVFGALESGKVDAAISSTIAGLSFESSHKIDRSSIVFTPVKLGYAVNSGKNADLTAAIDKRLPVLKNDKDSYYYTKLDEWVTVRRHTVPKELYWVIGGTSSCLLFFMVFVIILRLKVRAKTVSLKTEIEQRKQTEESLKRISSRQSAILSSVPDIIMETDANKIYTWANSAGLEFFGDDVIGKEASYYFQGEQSTYETVQPLFNRTEDIIYVESLQRRKDGTARLLAWWCKALWDEQGNLTGGLSTARDISDAKQTEVMLRESKEKYRQLVENLASGVVIHAIDSSVVFANPAALTMLGLSKEQIKGKTTIDPYWCFLRENGSAMPFDEYPVNQVLSSGTPLSDFIVGVQRPDLFDPVWVSCHAYPSRDAEGQLLQVVVTFSDITGLKMADKALNKRLIALTQPIDGGSVAFGELFNIDDVQRLQDEFAMATGVASIITDPDGIPLTAPSNFTRLCKDIIRGSAKGCANCFKSDAALGRLNTDGPNIQTCESGGLWDAGAGITVGGQHIANWLIGQVRDESQTEEAAAAYAGEIDVDEALFMAAFREVPAMSRTQFERIARTLFTLANQLSATAYQNVQQARFINERKQAEEVKLKLESQLQQAQKMESVGRLAGGVAHDFNNMLSVIMGHAELGLMHLDPTDPVCADFKEISKTAERSADLTRQLLAFARKQTVMPRIIDLNDTVTNMLKMLQRLIGEDIQLVWQPSSDLCQVKIDPSQIDQILANLCVNARDAIEDTGRITIETGRCSIDTGYCSANPEATPGDYVRLIVSDNGKGMDRETQVHIFEPFYTTKELGKGTGLGLATVYGAVKQNNGFINIYSEPGKGTTFSINLPCYAGDTISKQVEGGKQEVPRGQETILLVEDEAAILNITAVMLERQGYTVLRAGSPGRALELARENNGKIHLLMTDVIMPEMNGGELARNILAMHPNMKRLFMSGYTADVIAHHGVLDDGLHFIQKPFSLTAMAAMVREALDKQ